MTEKIFIIMLFMLLLATSTLWGINQESTQADSLNFFWNKYIKNAVYELNPCNGFSNVNDITVNNLVKYALNVYYQKKGFKSLSHYNENVIIYQISYSEVLTIINEHFGLKSIRINNLEEAVYNSKKQIISFDPRILSFYQKTNYHVMNPVLEKIKYISANRVRLTVNYYRDPEKKELINSIHYYMKKLKQDSFQFEKAEYQINPKIIQADYRGYQQIMINVDPQFYKNLEFLGSQNNKLFFGVRDFLSGIFNFYVVDSNTLNTLKQKSFYFGKKKALYKYQFDENGIAVIMKNKQYRISSDLEKLTEEVYIEPVVSGDYEKEMINPQNASINRFGDFYMNNLYAFVQESSIVNNSVVKGTFLRKKGDKQFKKIEIPGLEEDIVYRIDNDVSLGNGYAYFTSYRYNDDPFQPQYSLNYIDLNLKIYKKDIIKTHQPFLQLVDCSIKNRLLFYQKGSNDEKYYYLLLLDALTQ